MTDWADEAILDLDANEIDIFIDAETRRILAQALREARAKGIEDAAKGFDEAVTVIGINRLEELNPRQWHYCEIVVRINGENKMYEGDWLKNVLYWRRKLKNQP